MMDYVEFKLCKRCNELKPLDSEHFYAHKRNKSGFKYYCKSCDAEAHKKYSEQNREKVKAKSSEWHYKNKEILNKKSLEYWHAHKDRLNEKQRQKRANDPELREKERLKAREYVRNNPDKIKKRQEALKIKRQQIRLEKAKPKEIWIDDVLHKKCMKCSEFKPATFEYFYKNKNYLCGLYSYCKVCTINMQNNIKKDLVNHPEKHEKHKARMREYARANSVKNKVKSLESKLLNNITIT